MVEDIGVSNIDGTESRRRYKIALTLVATIPMPTAGETAGWKNLSSQAINALDAPFLSFARWGATMDHPDWLITGSAVGFYHINLVIFILYLYFYIV